MKVPCPTDLLIGRDDGKGNVGREQREESGHLTMTALETPMNEEEDEEKGKVANGEGSLNPEKNLEVQSLLNLFQKNSLMMTVILILTRRTRQSWSLLKKTKSLLDR